MRPIRFNDRQLKIIDIVRQNEPITSENIADMLNVTRATLRADLSVLTMTGVLDARPKVGYLYTGEDKVSIVKNKVGDIRVKELMSEPVIVNQDENVYDSIISMFLSDVGNIIVVDDGLLCGVVSRKDLLKSTIGKTDTTKIPIGLIMTRTPNIIVATEDENILSAAEKLINHQVDFLPVVKYLDKEKTKMKVVGRISKTGIVKLFVSLFE